MLLETALLSLAVLQPQPAPVAVTPLGGGVYLVKGGAGANTGFIVGSKEVVAIDAKMTAAAAQAMLAEIKKVTPNPVKTVVLTHSDGDHVNGLVGFPKGLAIVAHSATKKDMESMPALAGWLPTETREASGPLQVDGAKVSLLYFGPAHTSGDLVVLLPERRIAFVGDLVFVGRDPLIHKAKGGTSLGLVNNLKQILALDADTFISGHNEPLKKADIQELLASLEDKQFKIKGLIGLGRSLDEVKAALGVPAAPGRFPSLVEVIYQDLTAKK